MRWSDLIAFIDKLKSTPPRQSCPTSRLRDRHMVYTSSAISVMTWWGSGKRLGCGTANQQLPRSPYIRDTTASLEIPLASPQGRSGGGVLLRPRVWRGRHRVSTRDWNLMLNSSSSLIGGRKHTHTHTHTQLTCYGAPGVATILRASLVIGNFNDFCPFLAFDS